MQLNWPESMVSKARRYASARLDSIRHTCERGAVLLEASIVSILLVIIAAGTLEYASLFESTTDMSSALRSGARSGTITMPDGSVATDAAIIRALRGRSGDQRKNISRLVIYRATDLNAKVPEVCKTELPPVGVKCNVYTASDFELTEEQLAALPATQRRWPESERVPKDDYLGIWVRVDRPRLVTLIPAPSGYEDEFVMRIGPVPTSSPASSWNPRDMGRALPGYTGGNNDPWPHGWSCEYHNPSNCARHGGGGGTGTGGSGGNGS